MATVDPYASIRTLGLVETARDPYYGVTHNSGQNDVWGMVDPGPSYSISGGTGDLSLYRGGDFVRLPDGSVRVAFTPPGSDPGGYDALQADYAKDPATGQWTMRGDPFAARYDGGVRSTQNFLKTAGAVAAAVAGGHALAPELFGASGTGLAGLEGAIGIPELGLAAQTGLGAEAAGVFGLADSVYQGANIGGSSFLDSLKSLGSTLLGGSGGGNMNWGDILTAGVNLYATNRASNAASDANAIASRASDAQAQLASRVYDDYLRDFAPGLKESMLLANQEAKLNSERAARLFDEQMTDAQMYRDQYKNRLLPSWDKMGAEVDRLGSPAEENRQAGLAMTDVRAQGDLMRQALARDSARLGVNAASPAARALAQDAFLAEGLAAASAGTGARFATKDQYRQALGGYVNSLQGLSADNRGATGTAIQGANLGLQGAQTGVNAISTGLGAANQTAATASNIWNNSVGSAMNGFTASNQFMNSMANSPFTTLWGYNTGWNKPATGNGG